MHHLRPYCPVLELFCFELTEERTIVGFGMWSLHASLTIECLIVELVRDEANVVSDCTKVNNSPCSNIVCLYY